MLEKKIKKSLIETKEKKEKLLIEEKLIKDRFSMIFEGVKSEITKFLTNPSLNPNEDKTLLMNGSTIV